MANVYERIDDDKQFLNRHLDTVGDGTGSHDANVDGSEESDLGPQLFRINPPTEGTHVIHRLHAVVEDQGNFQTATYGALAALTNGLRVGYFNTTTNAIVDDLTAGHPIKTNFDWSLHAYPATLNAWGGGNQHLVAVWDFAEDGCSLHVNSLQPDRCFGVEVRDDLTGLIAHEFIAYGYTV